MIVLAVSHVHDNWFLYHDTPAPCYPYLDTPSAIRISLTSHLHSNPEHLTTAKPNNITNIHIILQTAFNTVHLASEPLRHL